MKIFARAMSSKSSSVKRFSARWPDRRIVGHEKGRGNFPGPFHDLRSGDQASVR
jgi:hypothetical protein